MAGLTTSQLRVEWAPACEGPFARFTFYTGVVVTIDPLIVEAVKALDACFKAWGYEPTPPDCGAFVCRKITNGTGWSLHALLIAIDINWQDNPYGKRLITDMPIEMIEAIEAIRTNNGAVVWRWGGRYSGNKDAMHFEVVCRQRDITTGINWATVPGSPPSPIPRPKEEEVMHVLIRDRDTGAMYVESGGRMSKLQDQAAVNDWGGSGAIIKSFDLNHSQIEAHLRDWGGNLYFRDEDLGKKDRGVLGKLVSDALAPLLKAVQDLTAAVKSKS